MKIGIKIKLAAVLSLVLFLTTLSMGAILIAHQRASLESQMRSMASTITDEFAGDSKMSLLEKDSLSANLLVESMLKYPGISDVYILDDKFLIQGHRNLPEVGREYYADEISIRESSGNPPWLIKEDKGILTFASPVIFKETTVGYVVLSFSDEFIKERVGTAITSAIAITVLAIILVSLVSIPMATRLLRPVLRLFKGTQEIALGNFDYRIQVKSKDEIGSLVQSFNNMASELKKKELLKGVFNRYVSPHVADEILKEPESIRLGGDRREVTVFFADIRGFTSLSISLSPEEIVEILNRYFTLLTEIIFRLEGTIDKFIGDAVMSVFGSPIWRANHLEHGVKAAVAVNKALETVNNRRYKSGLIPLYMGIGLDSGDVIVGNMGSQMRMEYTAIGEAVNMASRLSGLAVGREILVSEGVYKLIEDNVVAQKMTEIGIKGIEEPATIYNITDLRGRWKEEVESIVGHIIHETEKSGIV